MDALPTFITGPLFIEAHVPSIRLPAQSITVYCTDCTRWSCLLRNYVNLRLSDIGSVGDARVEDHTGELTRDVRIYVSHQQHRRRWPSKFKRAGSLWVRNQNFETIYEELL